MHLLLNRNDQPRLGRAVYRVRRREVLDERDGGVHTVCCRLVPAANWAAGVRAVRCWHVVGLDWTGVVYAMCT